MNLIFTDERQLFVVFFFFLLPRSGGFHFSTDNPTIVIVMSNAPSFRELC